MARGFPGELRIGHRQELRQRLEHHRFRAAAHRERLVLAGGVYVPPTLLAGHNAVAAKADLHALTPRQRDVLRTREARVGVLLAAAAVAEIDTPALLLYLDPFERNIDAMAQWARGNGGGSVALRPHAKSHKCPTIALSQIAAGAVTARLASSLSPTFFSTFSEYLAAIWRASNSDVPRSR